MSTLSERLRQLRVHGGFTVRELAELLGKTPGYISRIEGRGEVPSPELLCKIAEVYGLDPEPLFKLAKESQLERTERDISARYAKALALYRREKR